MFDGGTAHSPHPAASPASLARWMVAGVALINVFVFGMVAFSLYQSFGEYEERAEVTAQNLSQMLAQDIGREFEKIDVTLLSAVDEIERQAARPGGIDGQALNCIPGAPAGARAGGHQHAHHRRRWHRRLWPRRRSARATEQLGPRILRSPARQPQGRPGSGQTGICAHRQEMGGSHLACLSSGGRFVRRRRLRQCRAGASRAGFYRHRRRRARIGFPARHGTENLRPLSGSQGHREGHRREAGGSGIAGTDRLRAGSRNLHFQSHGRWRRTKVRRPPDSQLSPLRRRWQGHRRLHGPVARSGRQDPGAGGTVLP